MNKLESRKEALLELLIREYVKTAEPVGSSYLAAKTKLNLSAATVRNELAELEEAGYLIQPHTSAGRIPTEAAYRYFVEYMAHPESPAKNEAKAAEEFFGHRERAIQAAKILAARTNECVFVRFGQNDVYITGLANLFAKPEIVEQQAVMYLSAALDQLDEVINDFKPAVGARLLIGEENPLDRHCSTAYLSDNNDRVVGVLGLMRMDYEKVLGLLESIKF